MDACRTALRKGAGDLDAASNALIDMLFSFKWSRTVDPSVHFGFYYLSLRNEKILERFRVMFKWLRDYLQRSGRNSSSPDDRRRRMNTINPKYVLRNYMAQVAIDKAQQGDFSLIHELLDLLRHPYDEQPDKEEFAAKRPDWARHRPGCSMLSCSS